MSEYYYLNSALPPLSIGTKPELSFKEMKEMLAENLSQKDKKQVGYLLRPIDLSNIRAFWTGATMDEKGSFTPKELEEALLVRDPLPGYLVDYLEKYESEEERIRNFPSLYASLYRETQAKLEGFVLKYYQFEREVRLILTALRAKKYRRDIARELQFEEPDDPLVALILAQKDAADFIPPSEYEELKTVFDRYSDDPKALHQAILEYRFRYYEEIGEASPFSLDRVLSYLARLILVESWEALDDEKGKALIEELSKYG